MNGKLSRILFTVTEDVLGKLAFAFCFPEDERAPIDRASAAGVRVHFEGPFNGSIIILITREALPDIAANMLGVESDETSFTDQLDALKEIGNVVCGNLLPEITGKEALFNVCAPEIIEAEALEAIESEKATGLMKLSLEEGSCDVMLFIEGPMPEMVSGHIGGDDDF